MLGRAAVALWYDVPPEARAEWEDWHTHEHIPERVSIPGFLRGSRWVGEGNSYFGLYEVARLAALTGAPYRERLNNPTQWSQRMMPHHHHMVRSLCRVRAGAGAGLAGFLATVRYSPSQRRRGAIARWLSTEVIPGLATRKGFAGADLLQSAAAAPQSTEQKIRGADGTADWALLVRGYDPEAMKKLVEDGLAGELPNTIANFYRLAFVLAQGELKRAAVR
jgi:hypothetical protein